MGYLYLYDSRSTDEKLLEQIRKLKRLGLNIEIIDTSKWDDKKKKEIYFNKLIPISVIKKKKLRGIVRSHKAGVIRLNSILLTDDDFFTGKELEMKIKQLERELENIKKEIRDRIEERIRQRINPETIFKFG